LGKFESKSIHKLTQPLKNKKVKINRCFKNFNSKSEGRISNNYGLGISVNIPFARGKNHAHAYKNMSGNGNMMSINREFIGIGGNLIEYKYI